jgi:hypothetical protein
MCEGSSTFAINQNAFRTQDEGVGVNTVSAGRHADVVAGCFLVRGSPRSNRARRAKQIAQKDIMGGAVGRLKTDSKAHVHQ